MLVNNQKGHIKREMDNAESSRLVSCHCLSVTILGGCAHKLLPIEEPVQKSSNPNPPDQFEIQGSAEAMIGDLLIIRPIGIAVTAVGTAVFIVSLPLSVPGGNTKDVFKNSW